MLFTPCLFLFEPLLFLYVKQIALLGFWLGHLINSGWAHGSAQVCGNWKCSASTMIAFNPFTAGTAFMLMQTEWIQASRRVTRRLAWDPTCLLLCPSFPIKNKQNLKILKIRQYNLFLENYPASKGLRNKHCERI